jgi:multiple sugar transport system ATP-binding protein
MTMGQRLAVMRDGKIQQVGTPLEIYAKPANLFVAQFVGTPPMNRIPGSLGADLASVETEMGILALRAPLRQPEASPGMRLVLGVRPEDLSPSPGAGPATAVSARVEVVEPLGGEVLVHARAGDRLLIAKLPPDRLPAEGERIDLALDPARVHLFDAETERRIAPGGTP